MTGDERLIEAVYGAGEWEHGDWAHLTVIGMRLGVSTSTARRRCRDAAGRGLLEARVMHGWRYSKAVLSERFRVVGRERRKGWA